MIGISLGNLICVNWVHVRSDSCGFWDKLMGWIWEEKNQKNYLSKMEITNVCCICGESMGSNVSSQAHSSCMKSDKNMVVTLLDKRRNSEDRVGFEKKKLGGKVGLFGNTSPIVFVEESEEESVSTELDDYADSLDLDVVPETPERDELEDVVKDESIGSEDTDFETVLDHLAEIHRGFEIKMDQLSRVHSECVMREVKAYELELQRFCDYHF